MVRLTFMIKNEFINSKLMKAGGACSLTIYEVSVSKLQKKVIFTSKLESQQETKRCTLTLT